MRGWPPSSSSTSWRSRTRLTGSPRSASGTRWIDFYYDVIRVEGGPPEHLKVRSFVGLIPLFAALAIEPGTLERLPHFRRRMEWYLKYRPTLTGNLQLDEAAGRRRPEAAGPGRPREARGGRAPLARPVAVPLRLRAAVALAGLAAEPYVFNGSRVEYEPGESSSPIYGGNSNWRGPIWLPVNYLMVQALREYHRYYGSSLTVELPRGARSHVTLDRASDDIASRFGASSSAAPTAAVRSWVMSGYSSPTPTGATTSLSTSISTATTARAWAPATRPAGRRWSPS